MLPFARVRGRIGAGTLQTITRSGFPAAAPGRNPSLATVGATIPGGLASGVGVSLTKAASAALVTASRLHPAQIALPFSARGLLPMATASLTLCSTCSPMAYSSKGMSTLSTLSKSAAGLTMAYSGRGMATMPTFLKGQAASGTTIPRLPPPGSAGGRGPLFYFVVISVTGAGITAGLWYFSSGRRENVKKEPAGLPESLDWSLLPIFPDVPSSDYNWTCGSCWAVAAVKSVEAMYAIKTGVAISLSIQQVIDCAATDGCRGGTLLQAYSYMKRAGIITERDYPGPPAHYRTWLFGLIFGYCKSKGKPIAVTISGCYRVFPRDRELMRALQLGPVAVDINTNDYFGRYTGGIVEFEDCPPRSIVPGGRHCVLVVGYGKDSDGKLYYKIMNTYGPSWGEAGYARFRRGSDPLGVAGMLEDWGYLPAVNTGGPKL